MGEGEQITKGLIDNPQSVRNGREKRRITELMDSPVGKYSSVSSERYFKRKLN